MLDSLTLVPPAGSALLSNFPDSTKLRTVKSTPYPDTCEKYRDTPPISIAILGNVQKYALLLAESSISYTPPICVTIRLPLVSR